MADTRRQLESAEQQALFRWAAFAEGKYPELALMFHIPNEGVRTKANGARLKAEGLRAGVPDIMLPVARGAYHGLFVELKAGKNRPSNAQERWLTTLSGQGYMAVVCWGWESAKNMIINYLDQEG